MSSLQREPILSRLNQILPRLTLTKDHSASRIDLVKLDQVMNMHGQPKLDLGSKHRLTTAHGEEIVRAIVVDHQVRIPVRYRTLAHNVAVWNNIHCGRRWVHTSIQLSI